MGVIDLEAALRHTASRRGGNRLLVALLTSALVTSAGCIATREPAGATPAPAQSARPAETLPMATGADAVAFAHEACADARFDYCVEDVLIAVAVWPQALIAVCDYSDGSGDVVLIENEVDAEDMCSGGGLISPSRVVAVRRVP